MSEKQIIRYIVLCFFLWSIGYSCGTSGIGLFVSGGRDEMIRNAISDFIRSERSLLSKSDVFHVFTEMKCPDSIYVYVLGDNDNKVSLIVDIIDESQLQFEQEGTSIGERIITIDTVQKKPIMIVDYYDDGRKKSIWFDQRAVTLSYRAFPDHYYEWQNKLFFWFDKVTGPQNEKKEDVIDVMYRHHYVDTLVWCYWPGTINDAPEGERYLFYDKNLTHFSKKRIRGPK